MTTKRFEEALSGGHDRDANRVVDEAFASPEARDAEWLEVAIRNECPNTLRSILDGGYLDTETTLDAVDRTIRADPPGNPLVFETLQSLDDPIETITEHDRGRKLWVESDSPAARPDKSLTEQLVGYYLDVKAQGRIELMHRVADWLEQLPDVLVEEGLDKYARVESTPQGALLDSRAYKNYDHFLNLVDVVEPGPDMIAQLLDEGHVKKAQENFHEPRDEAVDLHDPDQQIPDGTDEDRRFQILQEASDYDTPSLTELFEGPEELRKLFETSDDRQTGLMCGWIIESITRNAAADAFEQYMPVLYEHEEYERLLKRACQFGRVAPDEAVDLVERILQHGEEHGQLDHELMHNAIGSHLHAETPRTGRLGHAGLVERFYDHGYEMGEERLVVTHDQRIVVTPEVAAVFIDRDELTDQQHNDLVVATAHVEDEHPLYRSDFETHGFGSIPEREDGQGVEPVMAFLNAGYRPANPKGYGRLLKQIQDTYAPSGALDRTWEAQQPFEAVIVAWKHDPSTPIQGRGLLKVLIEDVDLTSGPPEAKRNLASVQLIRAGWRPVDQEELDQLFTTLINGAGSSSLSKNEGKRRIIGEVLTEQNLLPSPSVFERARQEAPGCAEAWTKNMNRRQRQSYELSDPQSD